MYCDVCTTMTNETPSTILLLKWRRLTSPDMRISSLRVFSYMAMTYYSPTSGSGKFLLRCRHANVNNTQSDFSNDSASTTTGRLSAWTERYSALEVLEFEPRNRASDIFSLGCVLVEMVSGLYGHSLSEVKDHWRRTSNGHSSFARNPKATFS